jgi:hypothetical protein
MIKNKESIILILEKLEIISNNMAVYNVGTSKYLSDVVNSFNNDIKNNNLKIVDIENFRNSFNKGLNWLDMNKKDGEIWDEVYEMMTEIINDEIK